MHLSVRPADVQLLDFLKGLQLFFCYLSNSYIYSLDEPDSSEMPGGSQTLQPRLICARCSYWFPKPVRIHNLGRIIGRSYGSTSAPIWRPTRPNIPAFFSSNISIRGAGSPNYANLAQPEFLSLSTVKYPPPSIPLTAYRPISPLTLSTRCKIYSELSKSRLTILVVLTAMSGVALSPLPASIPVLLSTALGTTLCSASANTWNQISEVVYDAQMPRTRTRPLVRRAITPFHAACFGAATGVGGVALLWTCVNPVTAALGLGNIVLYSCVYTYMKRRTIANTWVGAVVGAIPPVMGWTACGGSLLPTPGSPVFPLFLPSFLTPYLDSLQSTLPSLSIFTSYDPAIMSASLLPPLTLAAIHFSWQFPHFNALAYSVRSAYARSGYAMLAALDATKNAKVAWRHSVALLGMCGVLVPLSGLTGWGFVPWGVAVSAILIRSSWRFWQALRRPVQSAAQGGVSADKAARVLWQNSLWYLPVLLVMIMAHKSGLEWGQWTGRVKSEAEQEKTVAPVNYLS